MTSILLSETRGAVRILTLNRPNRHNALSPELICRLADALDECAADDSVRALVVTGSGNSFCSGGDLELSLPLLSGARAPEAEWDHRIVQDRSIVFRASFKGNLFPKPVIAAVNGHCLAGGFELMLGTDIRIVADSAMFGLPEARHALIPFAGALVRLQRQIPPAIANELLLTGKSVDAAFVAKYGLVNEVLPADEVLAKALDIAERIAANGPLAVAAIREVLAASTGQTVLEGFELESAAMSRVMATEDAREGPRAFMERRKPVYIGR